VCFATMDAPCPPEHDTFTTVLSSGLIIGLVISYIPQHLRIILKRSSEGFSPWFLMLGSTASAAAMLNIIALQWSVLQCCRTISAGSCLESLGGIIQISLTWFLFTLILVLYMIYFPVHLKYAPAATFHDEDGRVHIAPPVRTEEWRLAITLSWVVAVHIVLIGFVTFLLVLTGVGRTTIGIWAGFLGVTSAISAAFQYFPQLLYTYRSKKVGALSIPMMCIQTPGAVLMVVSIAIRPGTDWTSWAPFAVAGIMQGALLAMCIVWHFRERRLGLDDFGHPVNAPAQPHPATPDERTHLLTHS